jgi:predicted O-methyltransferase YrrM
MIDDMTFTTDWVTGQAETWRKLLDHLIFRPSRGLEVGVFEGRSTQWWLKNILIHPGSSLYAIDPWVEKSRENLAQIHADPTHGPKLTFDGRAGQVAMADIIARGQSGTFDFVYLDGGKEAHVVMEQSVLAWILLKPGGIAIWDDYRWQWTEGCTSPRPLHPPAPAIDAFIAAYAGFSEELHRGWQLALRKLAP